MAYFTLVFALFFCNSLLWGQSDDQLLWQIEALLAGGQIEYDEYLWLKQWVQSPEEHCEDLKSYLELECQDHLSQHHLKWRYSRSQHRWDYYGSYHPQLKLRQSLSHQRFEFQNQRSNLSWQESKRNLELFHVTGSQLHPWLYYRPISMDNFQSQWQINRYFQGFKYKQLIYQETIGIQTLFSGHLQETQLNIFQSHQFFHLSSVSLNPQDHPFQIQVHHQYLQYKRTKKNDFYKTISFLDEERLSFLIGKNFYGLHSRIHQGFWKNELHYLRAKNLPPLISIPYLPNQIDSSRQIQFYRWTQEIEFKHLTLSHQLQSVDPYKSYFKNEALYQIEPKWNYSYQHRSNSIESLNRLTHSIRSEHGPWRHYFYWPQLRFRQVYSWESGEIFSQFSTIWKEDESRFIYLMIQSSYLHGQSGKWTYSLQWRQNLKLKTDKIWFRMAYQITW